MPSTLRVVGLDVSDRAVAMLKSWVSSFLNSPSSIPRYLGFMPTLTTYERRAYDKLFQAITQRLCNSNPSELSTYPLWELSAALNGDV